MATLLKSLDVSLNFYFFKRHNIVPGILRCYDNSGLYTWIRTEMREESVLKRSLTPGIGLLISEPGIYQWEVVLGGPDPIMKLLKEEDEASGRRFSANLEESKWFYY